MTEKIPPSILETMKNGFCPVCGKSMLNGDGSQSHNEVSRKVCEELLRAKLNIQRQKIKVGNKTYHVDAKFVDSETAKKMKEKKK